MSLSNREYFYIMHLTYSLTSYIWAPMYIAITETASIDICVCLMCICEWKYVENRNSIIIVESTKNS